MESAEFQRENKKKTDAAAGQSNCELWGTFSAKAQQVADANGGSSNNAEKGEDEKEEEEGNSVCSWSDGDGRQNWKIALLSAWKVANWFGLYPQIGYT